MIEAVARVPPEDDDLPVVVYAGELANTAALGGGTAPRTISGAGLDAETALLACLGEGAERYAAAFVAPGSTCVGTAAEVGRVARVVVPAAFALFSPMQYLRGGRRFPFIRWRARDHVTWVRARSLTRDDDVLVPAVFVHQPWEPPPGEPLLAPGISTGLACGPTRDAAIVAGLCEVIERDAVALAWLGCVAPPRFESPLDADTDALRAAAERRGFRLALRDLTTDIGVPVVAALLEGNSPVGSVVSLGAACRPTPAEAARKALVEAAHGRLYVKSLRRDRPRWSAGRRFEHVTSFADHALYYSAHPESRAPLDPWWDSKIAATDRHPEEDSVPAIVRRLADMNHEVIVADLTTPDLASLGLHVVRVLVPGLQPLHGNHAWPHLGGARLRRLARVFRREFGRPVRRPRAWNRWPHPCP